MLIVLFFFNAGDATQEVRLVSLHQPGGVGGVGSASGAGAEAEEPQASEQDAADYPSGRGGACRRDGACGCRGVLLHLRGRGDCRGRGNCRGIHFLWCVDGVLAWSREAPASTNT